MDMESTSTANNNDLGVKVTMGTLNLLGWPTDSFAIDFIKQNPQQQQQQHVHTVLVFVPGNPGLVEWYIPFFQQLLQALGTGYACRGAANAGHSLDPQKVNVVQAQTVSSSSSSSLSSSSAIPWSVDGQTMHKCALLDELVREFDSKDNNNKGDEPVKFILVSHSIGCHFTQRMCIWRPDILARTKMLIQLMPFFRMKAPKSKAWLLDWVGANPEFAINLLEPIARGFQATVAASSSESSPIKSSPSSSSLSTSLSSMVLNTVFLRTFKDPEGREVLIRLLSIPEFARNFLTMGCEEVRDLPEEFDVCALRYIGERAQCPIVMLFASNDPWSPEFHQEDLKGLQSQQIIPTQNISITYRPELQHDFVSAGSEQVPIVVQFCVNRILQQSRDGKRHSDQEQTRRGPEQQHKRSRL